MTNYLIKRVCEETLVLVVGGAGLVPALSTTELDPRAGGAGQGTFCAGQAVPAMGFHLKNVTYSIWGCDIFDQEILARMEEVRLLYQLPVKQADIGLLLSNQLPHFDLPGSHSKSTSTLLISEICMLCLAFNKQLNSNFADLILTASLKVGNLGFSPGRRGSNGFGLLPLEPPPPAKAVESSFLNLRSVRLTTCRLNTKPLKLGFFPISFLLGKICLFECCHSFVNVSDPFFQLSKSLTCLGSSFKQFEFQLLWIPCVIAPYYFGAKSLY